MGKNIKRYILDIFVFFENKIIAIVMLKQKIKIVVNRLFKDIKLCIVSGIWVKNSLISYDLIYEL
jgi:hypothetical protein